MGKSDDYIEEIREKSYLVRVIKKYISNIEQLLNKATDKTKIDKLEEISRSKLPEDFKNLYLNYNGENENVFGIMAGFRFMDIDSIIREHSVLQECSYEVFSDKKNRIKEGNFRVGWIPFGDDGAGSFLVLDLDPDKLGTYGQIITIDRESDISYVISDSINEFINFIGEGFKNKNLSIVNQEDVQVIQWKNGYLFDDILALSNNNVINNETYEIRGFWAEYFKDDIINGRISAEELAKIKMIFIKNDKAKEFKEVSLELLKHMPNLKELIIHADNIKSFEVFKKLKSLRKLVIRSQAFKEDDLEYVASICELKELTLVNMKLNNISALKNIKTLKSLILYKIKEFNSEALKELNNLTSLSLEEIDNIDFTYISELKKLKKLELKEIDIPNLEFLTPLKKLVTFESDRKAKDESNIKVFEGMLKLKGLIYPIGDVEVIKNYTALQKICIDVPNMKNLHYLSELNINSVILHNAGSEEKAKKTIEEIKKYCNITSYGWKQDWK